MNLHFYFCFDAGPDIDPPLNDGLGKQKFGKSSDLAEFCGGMINPIVFVGALVSQCGIITLRVLP
jgi:hypothetical protein